MKMNLANIKKAKKILDNNECVAIPTETVYGFAGNRKSDKPCKKIYKLKKRKHKSIHNSKKDITKREHHTNIATTKTIKDIIKGINNKDYSIEELVKHFIQKVDSLDKFNLVSEKTYDEAISLAKKTDTKNIDERRPLEGIPIAVKDIFCTVGNKTSASSNILKNFKAPYELSLIHI